jgi:putative ABC transport system substrate-binding protein
MMQRRQILALTAVTSLAATFRARAQQRPMRLGVLASRPILEATGGLLVSGLKRAGWEEGRNLQIHNRAIEESRYDAGAAELVAADVDVIFAPSDQAVAAAFHATKKIPIVMMGIAAVEPGYARSLAKPGGNVTGVVYLALDFIGKELALMRAVRPDVKRVGLSGGPGGALQDIAFRAWQDTARAQGAEAISLPDIREPAHIEAMLNAAQAADVQSMLIGVRPFLFGAGWQKIRDWATQRHISLHSGPWARNEVPIAYGPDVGELQAVVLRQIDSILRGMRPAEIPIEQPSKFELIVNRTIARSMGLTVPDWVMLSATEVL